MWAIDNNSPNLKRDSYVPMFQSKSTNWIWTVAVDTVRLYVFDIAEYF